MKAPTLYSNRVSSKLIFSCHALRGSGGGILKVGFRNEASFGISDPNKWLESFTEELKSNGVLWDYKYEVIKGAHSHLKSIVIELPSFKNLKEWVPIKGQWWIRIDEKNIGLQNPYEKEKFFHLNHLKELSLDQKQSFVLDLETDRKMNPRNYDGGLLRDSGADHLNRTLKVKETSDGSKTLEFVELNETFHSTNGALEESQHVFIENGFKLFSGKKSLKILEVGFGTGLNALLSFRNSLANPNQKVLYHTLEPYPIDYEIIKELAYPKVIGSIELEGVQAKIHLESGELALNTSFVFERFSQKIEVYQSDEKYDLLYFDAFAPNKQFELWSESLLKSCYDLLNSNGVLVSYCSKGLFVKNLRSTGFEVKKCQGPQGRREMTQGYKN